MTDRLSQLLHDEATTLVPPPPDTAAVLTEGRRLRRRHRVATGVAAASVAALVVATVGVVVLASDGGSDTVDPAATDDHVAWAVGSEVHVDALTAEVPDTVHSLSYTSAGVLVRSNPNGGASDGSGDESLTLVRWDGSTVDLGTVPEGVGPATDPDQDLYALAEPDGDGFVAKVHDVRTGSVVAELTLPDLPMAGWSVPPLALDGDTVYAGYRNQTVALDIATGDGGPVDGLGGGMPEVAGGRTPVSSRGSVDVLDLGTGTTVLSVDVADSGYGDLAPDGRFVTVVVEEGLDAQGNLVSPPDRVYDISTGTSHELPGDAYDWGWTSNGDVFRVDRDHVTTCDVATMTCTDTPLPQDVPGDASVRLAGRSYES